MENKPEKRFRDAMKEIPTSVSVILASHQGKISGCTISSLVSVDVSEFDSRILFVLKEGSRIGNLIQGDVTFSVNLLRDDMRDLADTFSSSRESFSQSSIPDFIYMQEQLPVIQGAPVVFSCTLDQVIREFASWIYVARVIDFKHENSCSPLIYQNRQFHKMSSDFKNGPLHR